MTKISGWIFTIALWCVAMAIAAPAQTFDSLFSFDGHNGSEPYYGSLVQGPDGNFYGTTYEGGDVRCNNSDMGCGTVFRITPAGTMTTIHIFCTGTDCSDGAYPYGGLVVGADGNLYGTTSSGGANGAGSVFKILPNGALKTLHSFDNSDGVAPYGTLIQAADGNFYGTTFAGGANTYGTVFKMTPSGTLTTLYSFCAQFDCDDGGQPIAGLVQGTDGNFYGTTSGGGFNNDGQGTVFKITTSGTLTTLHSFDGPDGSYPDGGLVEASNGSFYGTTEFRGPRTGGTIFGITPQGTFRTIYGLGGANKGAGAYPYDAMIQATDGKLYGTTSAGGVGTNFGTVFNVASGGAVTTLYSFDGTDGTNPVSGLVQSTNGNFYGTTRIGGADDYGTVFSLSMGLGPFVRMVSASGRVGQTRGILGQGFTGTTGVSFNGTAATFTVVSDTYVTATVPAGATTGSVTVITPSGTLTSNTPFRVLP